MAQDVPVSAPTYKDDPKDYQFKGQVSISEHVFERLFLCYSQDLKRDLLLHCRELEEDSEVKLERNSKMVPKLLALRHKNLLTPSHTFIMQSDAWSVLDKPAAELSFVTAKYLLTNHFTLGFKDEAQLAYIYKEVLEGLLYLHDNGIVHRNVKAETVLITKSGQVYLAGFQNAKVVGLIDTVALSTREQTMARTIQGHASYIAPEILGSCSTPKMCAKADVYGFGATAMELAYGRPPRELPYAKLMMAAVKREVEEEELKEKGIDPSTKAAHGNIFDQDPNDEFKSAEGSNFSTRFLHFTQRAMDANPALRASIKQLLEHDFLRMAMKAPAFQQSIERVVLQVEDNMRTEMSLPLSARGANIDSGKPAPNPDSTQEGSSGWDFNQSIRLPGSDAVSDGSSPPRTRGARHLSGVSVPAGEDKEVAEVQPGKKVTHQGRFKIIENATPKRAPAVKIQPPALEISSPSTGVSSATQEVAQVQMTRPTSVSLVVEPGQAAQAERLTPEASALPPRPKQPSPQVPNSPNRFGQSQNFQQYPTDSTHSTPAVTPAATSAAPEDLGPIESWDPDVVAKWCQSQGKSEHWTALADALLAAKVDGSVLQMVVEEEDGAEMLTSVDGIDQIPQIYFRAFLKKIKLQRNQGLSRVPTPGPQQQAAGNQSG